MEFRDAGIDYRKIQLFHFTASNTHVHAHCNSESFKRAYSVNRKGRWAVSFYRAPKGEFSGTFEIVSHLHVQEANNHLHERKQS